MPKTVCQSIAWFKRYKTLKSVTVGRSVGRSVGSLNLRKFSYSAKTRSAFGLARNNRSQLSRLGLMTVQVFGSCHTLRAECGALGAHNSTAAVVWGLTCNDRWIDSDGSTTLWTRGKTASCCRHLWRCSDMGGAVFRYSHGARSLAEPFLYMDIFLQSAKKACKYALTSDSRKPFNLVEICET